jgi:uncharacterized membrane protein YcfT
MVNPSSALGLEGIPVPFALGFQIHPWVERLLRVRQYPLAAYGLALLMLGLAVLVRGFVGDCTGVQLFTTFYPAIIVAALVGGLWPGIFATVLSAVSGVVSLGLKGSCLGVSVGLAGMGSESCAGGRAFRQIGRVAAHLYPLAPRRH